MKKTIYILSALLLLIFTATVGQNTERGASNEEELSDRLFHAIKMNDFDMMFNFLPEEEEILWLRQNCSETNKLLFNEMEEENVKSNAEKGFRNIIREGISQTVNWKQVNLVDYRTTSCSIDQIGCNVTFTIEDQKGDYVTLSYDAVKVNERWFLLQNLKVIE